MSKIKITQLNQTTSNLEVLKDQEISEVVGGYGYGYGYGGYSNYSYSYSDYSSKYVNSNQESVSLNEQTVLAGGTFSSNNATNNVKQGNNANIDLRY